MDHRDSYIGVADAAAQLGVNERRVRALLTAGELNGKIFGKTWLIDPDSLATFRHVRQRAAGRALAPVTAWAALLTSFATATTGDLVAAFGIVDQRRARIRALRTRDVDDWRWLARRRAVIHRYAARPAYLSRLWGEGGITLAGLSSGFEVGLSTGADEFDAYVDAPTAQRLTEHYRLRPAAGGNVTLRTINLADPRQLAAVQRHALPELVVAVDLIEDRDPRTSSAGRGLLTELLLQARTT